MNNLKRVLSLGLVGTMLSGLMVMGASAASKDFTDAADIVNKDAVSTMVALGVINGKEDGSTFDPKGNVTRAEMAKMICVALNGGLDPILGTKDTPSFTDIKGTWAEKYIEYCVSLNIINGRNDGTFGPTDTVTSTEAAKMILATLGYKGDGSGLTGTDWAINTNSLGNQVGLYKNLTTLNVTAPMSRDSAAQMLYNALDAKQVTNANGNFQTAQYTYTGTEQVAVGSERVYVFTAKTTDKGKLLTDLDNTEYASHADAASDVAVLSKDAKLGTDYSLESTSKVVYGNQSVTKTKDETFGHKYLTLDTYSEDGVYLADVEKDSKGTYNIVLSDNTTYSKVAEDFSSLIGEKVKVLSKASDNVYGVFASGGAVLATALVGNIATTDVKGTDTSIKIDGTSYKVEKTLAETPIYAYNNINLKATTLPNTLSTLPNNAAATIKVVDLDGNGKIDQVIYTPFTVVKVTYVGSTSFTAGGKSVKFDDANTYEGMAKNDYAVLTAAANTVDDTDTYTKVETIVNGTVTSTKSNGKTFQIDGTWYDMAASTVTGSATEVKAGNTISKAVVVNGYAFFVDTSTSVEAKDYAVVVSAVGSDKNGMLGNQAKLLFTDGTQKVVDTKYNYSGTPNTKPDSNNDKKLVGDLVTYKLDSGDYVLTAAIATNQGDDAKNAGFDEVLTDKAYEYAKNSKSTVGGSYIDPDAIVFVKKTNDKYTVVTGADFMKMPKDGTAVTNAYANKDSSTGYKTVAMAFVTGDVTSADTQYGYITSSIQTVKNDDGLVYQFTIFNGTDSVDVTTTNTTSDGTLDTLAKGAVISYVADGTGIDVKNVAVLSKDNVGAITSYNGDDEVTFMIKAAEEKLDDGTTLNVIDKNSTSENLKSNIEIDKDTVIIGINRTDKAGIPGAELALADTTPEGNYYANVYFVLSGSTASLIVYDTTNNILAQ